MSLLSYYVTVKKTCCNNPKGLFTFISGRDKMLVERRT